MKKNEISLLERPTITPKEMAKLCGIGQNKIYELCRLNPGDFVLYVGGRYLIKTKKFLEYIDKAYSI